MAKLTSFVCPMTAADAVSETVTILVVEDDVPTRALICQSLRSLGFETLEAADGLEGKDACLKCLPDILVTDVMMPKWSGTELVRWLRETFREPFVPVLMLTALGEVDHKVQGLAAGADDYLSKPFHYRELQARVQALLRIRKLTNDLYARSAELLRANENLRRAQGELIAKERELTAAQMAGAAAHNLGQPVTAILLHCRLLEKSITTLRERLQASGENAPEAQILDDTSARLKSIRRECETMSEVLAKLQLADPSVASSYVGSAAIIDLKRS